MKPMQFLFVTSLFFLLGFYSCEEGSSEQVILCENGGVGIDGICDCPIGYTGIHCEERATPDVVRITSLTVTRFPGLKENDTWDETDGPDIFFRLFDETNAIGQPDNLVENANASQSYRFMFHFIEMTHPTDTYRLQLLDYDGIDTKEDFMGEISFVPFDKLENFPENITLDDGGPVAFTLTLDYYYNNMKR